MCPDVAAGKDEEVRASAPRPGPNKLPVGTLQFQTLGPDFDDLVDSLIRRHIEVVLLRNPRRDEPGTAVSGDNATRDRGQVEGSTYRPPMK